MNAFSTVAAFTVLAATTVAFAALTPEPPFSQTRLAPDAALSSYQHRDSAASWSESDVGAKSGAELCQLKRDAMKDAATATAFAATAAQDGMVEVALATLALRKSDDTQLRELALRIAQDYAQSNGALDSIVKCEGLILPIELDAKHNASLKRLNAKSGRAFEKAYLKHIAERHSTAVALFESASKSDDADVAAFARQSLLMLHEHQVLADDLRAVLGTKVAQRRS